MYLLAREKGKIPNRAVSLSTPTTTPAPGLSPTRHGRNPSFPALLLHHSRPLPSRGRPRASLVGSGASDELVPFVARGTCKLGWKNPGHSDLSCGVQPCFRVSVQVHHAG